MRPERLSVPPAMSMDWRRLMIVGWLAEDDRVGAGQLTEEVLHVVWSRHGDGRVD
jgi:hypothetical protein